METLSNRLRLKRVLLALLLAFVWIEAFGVDVGERADAGQHEPLVVGLDYVVPEYKGGDKFRSPATIDTAIAEELARRLQRPLAIVGSIVGSEKAGLQLTTLRDAGAVPAGFAAIPVGYRAAPMAVLRTDTTIKRWEQLESRIVCVAMGGNHVGTIAARYGAIEKVHPSPADALVALRTGDCDAMVHDRPMLEQLIRLPEWKKFSARLPAGRRSTLAFLVPAGEKDTIALLGRIAGDWNADAYPDVLVKKAVRDIAFEVYLEQDVPDCH